MLTSASSPHDYWLTGCYQKLFGSSAGEALRTQVHGTHHRYAVTVPLLMSLGASGLASFVAKHEALLPSVRRLLREAGVLQLGSYLFEPPNVQKPLLLLHMLIPATLDANDALPNLLRNDRVGQQWEQLISSVHDAASSRGNPWWSTIVRELGSATPAIQDTSD